MEDFALDNRLLEVTMDGEVVGELALDSQGVILPWGLASDPETGHLFVLERGNDLVELAPPLTAPVDIRPGSGVNPVNPRSRGMLTVALLGTPDLDVNLVEPGTLAFGPSGAAPVGIRAEHVDDDSLLDLLMRFRIPETGIAPGDGEACLQAATLDGTTLFGCDLLRTTP